MSVIIQAMEDGFAIGSDTGPFHAYTSQLQQGGTFLSTEEMTALIEAAKNGELDDLEPLPAPPADPSYVAPEVFTEIPITADSAS